MGGSGSRAREEAAAARARAAQAEAESRKATAQANAAVEQKKLEAEMQKRKMEAAAALKKAEMEAAERKQKFDAEQAKFLEELKIKKQKEAAEVERQQKEQENKHQQEMQKLIALRQEQDQKLKIDQKNKAINEITNELKKYSEKKEQDISELKEIEPELTAQRTELENLEEKISKFDTYKKDELRKKSKEIGLIEAKTDLDFHDNQINAAVEKTSIHESNVGKFLVLQQALLNATLANAEQSYKLENDISLFGDVLNKECNSKLSIAEYFDQNNLSRLAEVLQENDFDALDDLKCDDDDEYQEIFDLVSDGVKVKYDELQETKDDEKEDKKYKEKLTLIEKRKLKKICLKPKDTWEADQNTKTKKTKESLAAIAPPLGNFFNRIYSTMKMSQNLLTYGNQLNEEQLKAIKDVEELENKTDDSGIADETDLKIEPLVKKDNEMAKQSMLLKKAAILSINVVDSMKDEFDGSTDKGRALGLAQSIESGCLEIVRSQGQIRQSVMLADSLLKLKPANLNEKSKQLWLAVDTGIINIYKNALTMVQTSSKFFGFFVKLRQSFLYFLSNKDESLVVSLEYLRKDVKEFSKFSAELNKTINTLNAAAMECIKNCVHTAIGAEEFEGATKKRETALAKYLETVKDYDKFEKKLDNEYEELLNKKVAMAGKKASLEYQQKTKKEQIQFCDKMINSLNNNIKILNEKVF